MTPVLLALLVFVAVGGLASAWLHKRGVSSSGPGNRARDASRLADLHWREFTRLVLQSLRGRGYEPVIEEGGAPDGIPSDGSDILLSRGMEERTLLSCKHGSSSVVGVQAILGLGKSATLRGASGVIVATPGRFDEEAVRVARQQGNVELLDGQTLWTELRPYVAPEPGKDGDRESARPAPQGLALAWGAAAIAAAMAWMLGQGMREDIPSAVAAADATAGAPAAQSAPTPTPQVLPAIPTDPVVLERRRRETAAAISTLPGVDRALWSTQSTLLVHLAGEEADPVGELCPLLERYPELAASRVQLQPPPGSTRPVRFKQCRTY